jgi:mannose-6-phosphate isomerase-like protein (cupin superfamily)
MFVKKEPDDFSFDKIGHKGKIFSTAGLIKNTQFVLIEVEDKLQNIIRQRKCDFCYYILEGAGFFEINEVREACVEGDLVVIPAGNSFTFGGKMKMLLNCTPPWSESQEETME